MANGILPKFDASRHAVVVLLVLKSHPGLAIRTGATVKTCNSKLPTMFFQALLVVWHI